MLDIWRVLFSSEFRLLLTWVLNSDEGLDSTDQDRCEVLHLLQRSSQHLPVDLVGQFLLPGIHLFGHSRQHWGQILHQEKREWFTFKVENQVNIS